MKLDRQQPAAGVSFALAAALLIAFTAAAGQAPSADQSAAQAPALAAKAPARVEPYVLQPGDEIEIRAYNIPELTQVARIRPDGKISLVLLNDVQAAGLTPAELNERLSAGYAQHFRNPKVTAIVRTFSNYSVYVGGEVGQPGQIPLGGELTVAAAIFRAGGFKDTARINNVILLRNGDNGEQTLTTLNLDEVLTTGKPDIVLRPLDVLYVPKSVINVYVAGEVNEPGMVLLDGNLTALAAVMRAKGFKPTAKPESVMLLRDSGKGGPLITKINLHEVLEKGKPDLALRPYDVVFVPKSRIAKVGQFMELYFRQVMPISVAAGFSYLLGAGVF